jgi:hypothetical protein
MKNIYLQNNYLFNYTHKNIILFKTLSLLGGGERRRERELKP